MKGEATEEMPRKISDQKDVPITEAKRILGRFKEEELGEFQRRTLAFATKFSKTSPAKADKMIKDLVEKVKLSQTEAIQVVNCMPENKEELRTILASKGKVITSDQLEEVLKLVSRSKGS